MALRNLLQEGVIDQPQPDSFSLNILYQSRLPGPRSKTNCREIEVPLILPYATYDARDSTSETLSSPPFQMNMALDDSETEIISCRHDYVERTFRFLSLPIELRLRIYALLLPSRVHSVVTQYPYNGYYYSGTSMVSHTTQTLYPAQPDSRPRAPYIQQKLTTYKLLNKNSHRDFPNPSIYPEILRTCKQIRDEAEPVMYGGETVFNFGVYIDAIVPFLKDRSTLAGETIRKISIAREIPVFSEEVYIEIMRLKQSDRNGGEVFDVLWSTMNNYLINHCKGLRTVDLTVWAENGGLMEETLSAGLGSAYDPQLGEHENVDETLPSPIRNGKLWRQWEWTRGLLQVEALRYMKVTWWGFAGSKATEPRFDSWLGRRMVADRLLKDSMVRDGRVIEGITLVPGDWCL